MSVLIRAIVKTFSFDVKDGIFHSTRLLPREWEITYFTS